jgi:hypothetical protein
LLPNFLNKLHLDQADTTEQSFPRWLLSNFFFFFLFRGNGGLHHEGHSGLQILEIHTTLAVWPWGLFKVFFYRCWGFGGEWELWSKTSRSRYLPPMKHGNMLFDCLLTTVTPELNPHIMENTKKPRQSNFIPLQKRRTPRTLRTSVISVEICGYGWTHIIGRSLTDMCYKRMLFCSFSILCFLLMQLSNRSKQCNILNLKGRIKHFVQN